MDERADPGPGGGEGFALNGARAGFRSPAKARTLTG